MDTKFSVALHILTMISESKEVLSSQSLATSVGTNASYIRKVIALLKNAGLITSHQGKSGYQLAKTTKEMTLLEIYYATQEVSHISLFQIHQNANVACPVGKHIEGAMSPIFTSVEKKLEEQLANQTLENVIENLYKDAGKKRNLAK
ncbi:MAG: Rrf2 family transcriptional regulator [Gemella sp.]|nr:Rrf2 family transcriptional regulator [Gemella sp.]